jgi:hypothetical protein
MSYTAIEALMFEDRAKAIDLGIEPCLLTDVKRELAKSKALKKKSRDSKHGSEQNAQDYAASIEALRDAWRLLTAFIKSKHRPACANYSLGYSDADRGLSSLLPLTTSLTRQEK